MTDCIHHTDYDSPRGYGRRMLDGKVVGSHRVVYCEANNIPIKAIEGLHVRHTCDNPRCVNPEHLLIGTHQDNVNDKVARNRQVKGVDVHTAILSEEDVAHIRSVYKPRDRQVGASALGRLYGVHNSTINRIVNGKTWRSV